MHPSSINQRKIKTLQRETEKHSQQGNGYRASSSWQQIRVFKTEDLGESKEAEEGDTESKIESFEQRVRKAVRQTKHVQTRPKARSVYRYPRCKECMCRTD